MQFQAIRVSVFLTEPAGPVVSVQALGPDGRSNYPAMETLGKKDIKKVVNTLLEDITTSYVAYQKALMQSAIQSPPTQAGE